MQLTNQIFEKLQYLHEVRKGHLEISVKELKSVFRETSQRQVYYALRELKFLNRIYIRKGLIRVINSANIEQKEKVQYVVASCFDENTILLLKSIQLNINTHEDDDEVDEFTYYSKNAWQMQCDITHRFSQFKDVTKVTIDNLFKKLRNEKIVDALCEKRGYKYKLNDLSRGLLEMNENITSDPHFYQK
jgi:carboxypeptidase C (cathepsin A)